MTQLALVDDGRNSAYSVILYNQHNYHYYHYQDCDGLLYSENESKKWSSFPSNMSLQGGTTALSQKPVYTATQWKWTVNVTGR